LFVKHAKETIISQKQTSARPASTNKHHAIDKTHTQEKKPAKMEEKKPKERIDRNTTSKAKKGTKTHLK
jgi:hypothetical protein